MASDIGTAYVNIVPKAQGIKGQMTNMVNGAAGPAGSAGGKLLGLKMAAGVAAAAIGAVVVTGIKKSLTEGAALEQSLGGIETLFKKNADMVVENARKAYKTAGISANEYMETVTSFSASLISSLSGDTKKAGKIADMAIVDMSDNANKMGTDMESIQNAYQGFAKKNYTMLDNLKLGYGGTKEEMERLLEDAGKLSGQTYDIKNLSDVYEAIHVIQEELDITGTTSKEASETLAGSLNSMKAAFSDLMGNLTIGENVEGSMKALIETTITFFKDNLIPAIGRIFQSLPVAISAAIGSSASNIDGSAILAQFGKIVELIYVQIPPMIEKVCKFLSDNAPTIAEYGTEMIIMWVSGAIKALPTAISAMGQLVNAILKVVVGIPVLLLAKGLSAVGNFALGLLRGTGKVIAAAGKWVSGIVDKVKTLPGKIAQWAKNAADKLLAPFNTSVDKIKGFFPINIGKILSNVKLPHFSVSGGKAPWGFGGEGSLPKISVSWHAKGGLVTQPTLFAGLGERGDEAILPLDPFWKKLDNMKGGNTFNINMTVSGAEDPEVWAGKFARRLELEMRA